MEERGGNTKKKSKERAPVERKREAQSEVFEVDLVGSL